QLTVGGSGTVTLTAGAIDLKSPVTSTSGSIILNGDTVVENSLSTAGNITVLGGINEAGAGVVGAAVLTTSSSVSLSNNNAIKSFQATNSGAGNVLLTNTASTFTVAGISQTGGGNVTVTNTGNMSISGAVATSANGN